MVTLSRCNQPSNLEPSCIRSNTKSFKPVSNIKSLNLIKILDFAAEVLLVTIDLNLRFQCNVARYLDIEIWEKEITVRQYISPNIPVKWTLSAKILVTLLNFEVIRNISMQ
jgi:hypothetical protein